MTTDLSEHPPYSIRVKLTFPDALIRKPFLAQVIREFDVVPNILSADVTDMSGNIVCDIEGDADAVTKALDFLTAAGVEVSLLDQSTVA